MPLINTAVDRYKGVRIAKHLKDFSVYMFMAACAATVQAEKSVATYFQNNTGLKTEYTENLDVHEKIPDSRQGYLSLIKFAFSSSFRLLFTAHARLFVMFSLTNLLLNAGLCAASLESTQS